MMVASKKASILHQASEDAKQDLMFKSAKAYQAKMRRDALRKVHAQLAAQLANIPT